MKKVKRKNRKLHKNRYVATFLTCLGSLGVVATAISAVRQTPKAISLIHMDSEWNHDGDPKAFAKKEAVITCWKCYIPTMVIGVSTIACIFGANIFNKRQQASLVSAYTLLNNYHKQYKNKLKELYGEEVHNEVVDAIAKEKCSDVHISCPGLTVNSTLDIYNSEEPEVIRTFYDVFSNRYFESSLSKVIEAEYHLNRNLLLGWDVCLNDFYNLLGLMGIDSGDILGWEKYWDSGEFLWIDFNHRTTKIKEPNGSELEVCIIEFVFEPVLKEY